MSGKIPVDRQFLKLLRLARPATTTMTHSESLKITFLVRSDAQVELEQVIVTMSTFLNALSCCHVG